MPSFLIFQAYSAIDTDGKGYITRDDFMKSLPVSRAQVNGVTLADILELVIRENLFKQPQSHNQSPFRLTMQKVNSTKHGEPKMDFETFKKTFFPRYFLVEDASDLEDD